MYFVAGYVMMREESLYVNFSDTKVCHYFSSHIQLPLPFVQVDRSTPSCAQNDAHSDASQIAVVKDQYIIVQYARISC